MLRLLFVLLLSFAVVATSWAEEVKPEGSPDESGVKLTTKTAQFHAPRVTSDRRLKGLDLDKFGLVREFYGAQAHVVGDIAIAPDGSMMMASCGGRNVAHWDTATGQLLGSFQQVSWRVAFAPNEARALVATPDAASLLRLGTGAEIGAFSFGGRDLKALVATTPNADKIAIGLHARKLIVWNPKDGSTVQWQSPDEAEIKTLVISLNGNGVCVQTEKSLRFFDARNGRELWKFTPPEAKIWGMTISPDGRLVAAAMHKPTAMVFDAETGKTVFEVRLPSPVASRFDSRGFAFTADAEGLLLHYSGGIMMADLKANEVTMLRPMQDYHHWIVYSPDRRHFFTHCANDDDPEQRDGVIRMWQVDPWTEAAQSRR